MSTDLERNKQNVVAFYDLMFNRCRPAEAIELLKHLSGDKKAVVKMQADVRLVVAQLVGAQSGPSR